MKKTLWAALLLWGGLQCHAGLTDSLEGYWQMDGAGADGSGNSLDVTLSGGTGYDSGLMGQALSLSDQSTYAYRAGSDSALDFGSNDFTIQVWANLDSVSREQVLIEKFSDASGPGWTLAAGHDTGTGRLLFYGDGIGAALYFDGVLSADAWNHIVAQRSGSTLELFVNGTSVGSSTISGSISSSPNGLLIGRRNTGDERDFSTDGRLDELAVWSRALSSDEITALYNNGAGMAVPEPASVALLGIISGIGLFVRRRFLI